MRLVVLASLFAVSLALGGCAADSTDTSEEPLSAEEANPASGAVSGVDDATTSLEPGFDPTTGPEDISERPAIRAMHPLKGEVDRAGTTIEGH